MIKNIIHVLDFLTKYNKKRSQNWIRYVYIHDDDLKSLCKNYSLLNSNWIIKRLEEAEADDVGCIGYSRDVAAMELYIGNILTYKGDYMFDYVPPEHVKLYLRDPDYEIIVSFANLEKVLDKEGK